MRKATLRKGAYDAAIRTLREFVPRNEDCQLLTWRTGPRAFLYLVPYFFMAYLVRRRDTHLLRVLLLPTVVAMAVRCTWSYTVGNPWYTFYEWDRGILALVVIAKSIDFACAKDGRLKLTEKELRAVNGAQLIAAPSSARRGFPAYLPDGVHDALEVGLSLRGLGWDFGRYVYVPPPTQPRARRAFLHTTLARLARNVLLVDALDTLIKLTPGLGPEGGTLFLAHLAPAPRYALSTALHAAHGLLIAHGVEIVYDSLALSGVVLLTQDPRAWPPVDGGEDGGGVWRARSLHDFWARRWHQALRYVFLVLGGFLGARLGGRVGATFGAFAASAFVHEVGITAAGVETDWRVVAFFLLQAVGISLEKAFRWATGRRVGGPLGFVWMAVFVLGFGQMCTDSWFARGIGGGTTVPLSLSIVRRIILPFVRYVIRSVPSST